MAFPRSVVGMANAQHQPRRADVWRSDYTARRTRRRLHAVLDGGENRPTKPLREFDGREIARRIEIVLTGLVDHAELIMLGGVAVGQNAINLVLLQ